MLPRSQNLISLTRLRALKSAKEKAVFAAKFLANPAGAVAQTPKVDKFLKGTPGNGPASTSQGAVSFAYVNDENHASARIGAADIAAGQSVSVTASANNRPDVTAQARTKADDEETENGGSIAVAYGSVVNDADAIIASGAQVDARGTIDVSAEAVNELDPAGLWGANIIVPLTNAAESLDTNGERVAYFRTLATYLDDLGNLGLDSNLVDSWSQASASGQEKLSVAGAVTVLIIDHDADAIIESGAMVNQDPALSFIHLSDPSVWSSGTNTLESDGGVTVTLDGTETFDSQTESIVFTAQHGLADGDIVTYKSNLDKNTGEDEDKKDVSGLNNKQTYRVVVIDGNTIKLTARTVQVAASSINNAINLAGNFPPLFDALKGRFSSSPAREDPGKAVGATFHWFDFENDVHAKIEDGAFVDADGLKVNASNAVINVTLGISGGDSKDFGFNGVGIVTNVDNDSIAQIEDGAVVQVGNHPIDGGLSALVEATDATYVISVAGALSSSEKTGIGGAAAVNDIDRTTEALIGGALTVGGDLEISAANDGFIGAFALAGAIAKAPPKTRYVTTALGGAVSFASNNVDEDVRVYINEAVVNAAGDVTLSAVDATTLEAFAFGGAYAQGDENSIALAGAAALNTLDSTIEAYVRNSELSLTGAGDLTVTARDESGVFAQTGTLSIAAGTGKTQEGSLSVSIGASVSINEIGEHEGYGVRAFIDNSTVDVNGNVLLQATYSGEVESLAVGGSFSSAPSSASGSGSYAVAAAGAYAANELSIDIETYIAMNSVVTTTGAGDVTAAATVESDLIRADAFGVAAAFAANSTPDTAGAFAFGVAIASNTVSLRSDASVRNSGVNAAGAMMLSATAAPDLDALAIGVAGSGASGTTGNTGALAGAGSAATNTVDNTVAAYIKDSGDSMNPGVLAGTTITLGASDDSKVRADSGGFAIALGAATSDGTAISAAVGAGITINEIGEGGGHSVKAFIENSTVEAGGNIGLSAISTAEVEALSMGGAGAGAGSSTGKAGALAGAGAGSYNTIEQTIESYISVNSAVTTTANSGGDITLSAQDRSSITADAGGVAVAVALTGAGGEATGSGSIGAAIADNTISNVVNAYISGSEVVADGDVDVSAFARPLTERTLDFGDAEIAHQQPDSITIGGAEPVVGAPAAVELRHAGARRY